MTDREKVIKALECRLDINGSKYKHCLNCDYRHDIDHYQWACQTDGILEDALALLKAQEPRVMTLEEMQKIASIRDGAIWLEAGAGLMPAFMEFATKDITFFVAVPLTGYRQFFENDWYGKTWRCWTSRPDQATREAVKWDAQEQRDYEAAVEMAEYCERYEPTYNADDGSM